MPSPPPLTTGTSPLARLRALFLAATLLAVAANAAAVVADGDGRSAALAVALSGALGGSWIVGFRRRSFAPALEPLEVLALLGLLAVSPGHPVVPLVALLFRSMYGGPLAAVVRTAAFLAVLFVDELLWTPGAEVSEAVSRAFGLLLGAALMTWLRQALDASDRSGRLLRAIVEQSTDVVCLVDAELRLLWLDESVVGRFGYPREQLVGRPVAELVAADDVPRVERTFATVAAQPGGSSIVPTQMTTAAGDVRWIEAGIVNRLDDPDVTAFVVTLRDTTERRRLEEERSALELERQRVEEERARHELEARLQRSERLGSVGQLAGGIAHDFNNLLGVILNFAAFIREDLPAGSPSREDLDQIEHAARRGADLTRQLLVFSQRRLTKPEVVDLTTLVGSLDRLLSASLSERVTLELGLHEAPLRVLIDPGHAEQVLVNLVVNARDALDGGGTISVSTKLLDLDEDQAAGHEVVPGRYACVVVRDDGCGMDPETLARAVEPFFTTKPAGRGTGLGLATVASIAQAAGGAVRVESTVGEGTTVSILLPETDGAGAVSAPPGATRRAGDQLGAGTRVLLAEDEDGVRALVERILAGQGFEVVATGSGEEALEVFERAGGFDLLVSDVVMPGISGVELVERLRGGGASLPVLLMSGYSEELLRAEGAQHDKLLSKPFDAEALCAAVAELLDGAGVQPVAIGGRA